MGDLMVKLHHDGVFVPNPLKYVTGECQIINDIQFEEMKVDELFQDDMEEFLVLGYQNGNRMDLYTEFNGYDVLEYRDDDNLHKSIGDVREVDEEVDEKVSEDDVIDNVEFHTEGKGNFIDKRDDPIQPLSGTYIAEEDPEDDAIDPKFKVKRGVKYPSYNPDTPWDEFVPILGMKFENPEQLKIALADYGVKHGYQLWYYRSDYKSLLVYCARDVSSDSEGAKVNKKKSANVRKKPVKDQPKEKCTRIKMKDLLHHCPFRLWASWMGGGERSFQIKTLYSVHKCTRKYHMGSLVTFRWIARHYANVIIHNPSMTYRFMKDDIRDKFMIDVVPSVYQVVDVRKKDEAYSVNLMTKTCHCKLWQLSGVPCIHAVAAFMHFKMEPKVGVSDWYSQSKWFDIYQYSIKPVFGSKFWKPTSNALPFPPIVKKMPGRPKKNRIKHPIEELNEHAVSRVGRVITCQNCQGTGHNKTTCTQPKKPKPQKQFKPIKKPKVVVPTKKRNKKTVGETSKAGALRNKKAVGETSKAGALRNKKACEAGTSKAGVGGSASMNTEDQNAMHEVMQQWSDIELEQAQWPSDGLAKPTTVSVLEAVDEAHDLLNAELPSISEHSVSMEVIQSEQPNNAAPIASQPLDIATSESQTNMQPRQPRQRPAIRPRNRSERIAKRRKFNFPADSTGRSKDNPFTI
ncbi:hypothetical protein CTI12_AA545420 [Artemisia annua]|uniref:SWIM-type domain-containing protein n=1 Tax=Artemisia annua TaxID=35608 RepID=A0A2U1L034_ARTAN|nr:hypothetical protein CTI12_AA545420 [Artemisia annua]